MEKIKVIHDTVGKTLTIWLSDPEKESVSEETSDEVVFMKDKNGKVIGFEVLNYEQSGIGLNGLQVETILNTGS